MKRPRQHIDWEQVKARLAASQLALAGGAADRQRLDTVYRQRAARFAQRRSGQQPASAAAPWLVFLLGTERYAFPLADVVEVLPWLRCTPVPQGPPALLGIVNIRGEVRSLVDLARLLGPPGRTAYGGGKVLLLRKRGREFALRVDDVEQVRSLEPVPGLELDAPYLEGRSLDGVLLLDSQALLSQSLFGASDADRSEA
jgi:chemotaxis signal transduction protein